MISGQLAALRTGDMQVRHLMSYRLDHVFFDQRAELIAGNLLQIDEERRDDFAGHREHRLDRVAVSGRVQIIDDHLGVIFANVRQRPCTKVQVAKAGLIGVDDLVSRIARDDFIIELQNETESFFVDQFFVSLVICCGDLGYFSRCDAVVMLEVRQPFLACFEVAQTELSGLHHRPQSKRSIMDRLAVRSAHRKLVVGVRLDFDELLSVRAAFLSVVHDSCQVRVTSDLLEPMLNRLQLVVLVLFHVLGHVETVLEIDERIVSPNAFGLVAWIDDQLIVVEQFAIVDELFFLFEEERVLAVQTVDQLDYLVANMLINFSFSIDWQILQSGFQQVKNGVRVYSHRNYRLKSIVKPCSRSRSRSNLVDHN